jgi:hypothetical protein
MFKLRARKLFISWFEIFNQAQYHVPSANRAHTMLPVDCQCALYVQLVSTPPEDRLHVLSVPLERIQHQELARVHHVQLDRTIR